MTVRQKSWVKRFCQLVVLLGATTLFVRLGFQGYSFCLTIVCMALVQIFVWGNIWAGEELSDQDVRRQYVHLAIGAGLGICLTLMAQFFVIGPSLRG